VCKTTLTGNAESFPNYAVSGSYPAAAGYKLRVMPGTGNAATTTTFTRPSEFRHDVPHERCRVCAEQLWGAQVVAPAW
jgi:hypothetical protein